MRKEKPKCKNCGDETTFPRTCDMEREQKGWCVPCYSYWKKNRIPTTHGEVWLDRTMYASSRFNSRGTDEAE